MTARGKAITVAAAIVLALLTGCSNRIAPHDAAIATGLAVLRESTDRFFDELRQSAGTQHGTWEYHANWYEETRAAIGTLRGQAAVYGSPNAPTVDALDVLKKGVDQLEEMHTAGLSAGEIPVLHTLFDSQLRMLIELEAAKKRDVPKGGKPPEVTP